jgi:predicted DNA-binding transcriptional regulator AlpA
MLSDDPINAVRVLSKRQAYQALGVSLDTWNRMDERGELPPKTQISPGRIGYRVTDLKAWLDARRIEKLVAA